MSWAPGRRKPSTTGGEGPAFHTVASNVRKGWASSPGSTCSPDSRSSLPVTREMPVEGSACRSGRGTAVAAVAARPAGRGAGNAPTRPEARAAFSTSARRRSCAASLTSRWPAFAGAAAGAGTGLADADGEGDGEADGDGDGDGVGGVGTTTFVVAVAAAAVTPRSLRHASPMRTRTV